MALNVTSANLNRDTLSFSHITFCGSFPGGTQYNLEETNEADKFISDNSRQTCEFVVSCIVIGIVSVLGLCTNSLNIRVYWTLGFRESITVALFALSISDLIFLIFALWIAICQAPAFRHNSNIGHFLYDLIPISGGFQRMSFNRLSAFITALITIERCYCIVKPLKVKQVFTPRRTALVILVFSGMILCLNIPIYASFQVGLCTVPGTNTTRPSLIPRPSDKNLRKFVFGTFILLQFVSLFTITLSVVSLLYVLQRQKRRNIFSFWSLIRKQSQSATVSDSTRTGATRAGRGHVASDVRILVTNNEMRQKRLGKMVCLISAILLAAMIPATILNVISLIESEFNFASRYSNVYVVSWSIANTIEALNASCNIVVYYYMSSSFRTTLNILLRHGETTTNILLAYSHTSSGTINLSRLQGRSATVV